MSNITKKALEASLKKMMLKKPLAKITIRDITDDCGISRMTFYYHFQDIYDLIEWSCIEDATQATHFARCGGNLYMLDEDGKIWITGNIQNPPEEAALEGAFDWLAEFADWYEDSPNKKNVSKILLRLEVDEGAEVKLYIMFDSTGEWIPRSRWCSRGWGRGYRRPRPARTVRPGRAVRRCSTC